MRLKSSRLLALAFVFVGLSACDRGPGSSIGPTAPQSFLTGATYGDYVLANDPVVPALLGNVLSLTKVLSSTGGVLGVVGHSIDVPRRAVLRPTLFTVLAIPSGYVEVDLSAGVFGLLGGLLDIGHVGFRQPVTVTLSFDRSTNIPDPSQLVVLRLNGPGGRPEALPTQIDYEKRTVTAKLDHFSRYAIAFPGRQAR